MSDVEAVRETESAEISRGFWQLFCFSIAFCHLSATVRDCRIYFLMFFLYLPVAVIRCVNNSDRVVMFPASPLPAHIIHEQRDFQHKHITNGEK